MDNLLKSLVGSHIDFSFKRNASNVLTIEKGITLAKSRIDKDVEKVFESPRSLGVKLLAELTSYYSHQPFYWAVRSHITMRRLRPAVLLHLEKSVEERAESIKDLLKTKADREVKITVLKYFLGVYPSRLREFKELITREEYLIVA